MIPELGLFALILALCFALLQSFLPFIGIFQNNKLLSFTKPIVLSQLFFLFLSMACLMFAFVSNDFSVLYVAQHSNSNLPLVYRIAAVWGAHEGSLLLWVTILSAWTVAVCLFSKQLPLEVSNKIIGILGLISVGFLIFLLATSNPFQRLLPDFPPQGQDLNPLLQDPGLAFHPPVLYTGYVGFAVAFAFAITALLQRRLDATWIGWMRSWTQIAWCFLTCGIAMGSWWAYRVLGWGGWWFWDPVENASLLPWLAATALIHSMRVVEKRDAFKGWVVLLSICTFSLSLIGTFLVRSGILVSVHSFASDPTRGDFMLKFLSVVIGVSLLIYMMRGSSLNTQIQNSSVSIKNQLFSREMLLLSNNVILFTLMMSVLLGTLYPLVLQLLGLGKISVGPPYFNAILIPLVVPLFLLMGAAPYSQWLQMDPRFFVKQLWIIFIASLLGAIFLSLVYENKINGWVILGVGSACWLIFTILFDVWNRWKIKRNFKAINRWGMVVAHLGVAICILGVTMTSTYHQERDLRMSLGEVAQVGPYEFKFLSQKNIQGPNYTGIMCDFRVSRNQKEIAILQPEKRIYTAPDIAIAVPAINPGIWRDLYVAMGEQLSNSDWSIRIYYKPWVRWIWLGGLTMALGGFIAIFERRKFAKYRRNLP